MKSSPTRSFTIAIASILALAALPTLASAQILTLAGFESFPTDSTGSDNSKGYVFNDNSSAIGEANATITEGSTSQSSGIALPLSLGANDFSFSAIYPDSNGSYFGVGLFFTGAAGGSFNPAFGSTTGDPELSAFTSYPGVGASRPASGALLADYADGAYTLDSYSGARSYTLNGYTVSITGLTTSGDGGTFVLTVTPATAPEPSSVALAAMGLGLMVLFVRARRTA
jgi:hypothetical protein